MGLTARQIANRYIGEAKQNPQARPDILRQAAYTFMGLAQNPKYASTAGQLAKIGLDFAAAAVRERPFTIDDFTDTLQETQQAYQDVGDDSMDLVARRREIHDERTPATPGSVSIAPESFNRDATLGRSAVVRFDPSAEDIGNGILQSQNVAFWQGTKKEAQAMTVDVSLGEVIQVPFDFEGGSTTGGINIRPYAEVEFGSDGNRNKVMFDIALGKRVTVVGNYVAVTVGMRAPKPGSPNEKVTLGASIGTFAAPSQGPVVYTQYVDQLADTEDSEVFPIPLKAVMLLPIQTDLPLGSTSEIQFYDLGGDLISRVFYQQSDTSAMQPIPITGDVAFVLVNNSGGGRANFRLPFQLAM